MIRVLNLGCTGEQSWEHLKIPVPRLHITSRQLRQTLVGLQHQYFFKASCMIPVCSQCDPMPTQWSQQERRSAGESSCEARVSIFTQRVRRTQESTGDSNGRRWKDPMTGEDVFRKEGKGSGGCSGGPGGHLPHPGPVWEENTTTLKGCRGSGAFEESKAGHAHCEKKKGAFRDEVRKWEILLNSRGPFVGFGDMGWGAVRHQKCGEGRMVLRPGGMEEDRGGPGFLG